MERSVKERKVKRVACLLLNNYVRSHRVILKEESTSRNDHSAYLVAFHATRAYENERFKRYQNTNDKIFYN